MSSPSAKMKKQGHVLSATGLHIYVKVPAVAEKQQTSNVPVIPCIFFEEDEISRFLVCSRLFYFFYKPA